MSSSSEDVPTTTRHMATRSRNADAHPGLVDAPELQAPRGGVTKKKIAEQRKKAKLQKEKDAIRSIGEAEKKMAEDTMVDMTPGPRASTRRQTGSFLNNYPFMQLPPETDTLDSDDFEGTNIARHMAPVDTEASENKLPKKKTKPKKTKIRDSVKEYIEQDPGEKADEDQGYESTGTKGIQRGKRSANDLERVSEG